MRVYEQSTSHGRTINTTAAAISISISLLVGGTVACSTTPAKHAREGAIVDACRLARSASSDEDDRRELLDELLVQSGLQVRVRDVSEAELAPWLEHPVTPEYAKEAVTVDLDARIGRPGFDVTLERIDFENVAASYAVGRRYYELLGIPRMPHERRMLAQGREVADVSKKMKAILGHAATGGVGIMAWWALGGHASDLIPKTERRREPPLSEAEQHDIEAWAGRTDVRAVVNEPGFALQAATMLTSAQERPGATSSSKTAQPARTELPPTGLLRRDTSRTFRSGFLVSDASSTYAHAATKPGLVVQIRFTTGDANASSGTCELGVTTVTIPVDGPLVDPPPGRDNVAKASAPSAPLSEAVKRLAARGWMRIDRQNH